MLCKEYNKAYEAHVIIHNFIANWLNYFAHKIKVHYPAKPFPDVPVKD